MTRPDLSEEQLLDAVVDLCALMGLMVHHSRPARQKGRDGLDRWVTPIKGDKGLPDLIIAGPRGVLWRELKSTRGRVRPEQQLWLARLAHSGQDVKLWRPADWPHRIKTELQAIR